MMLAGFMVVLALAFPLNALANPDTLEVLPTDHDFGDVEVGTTASTLVSMTNINGSPVEVYGLAFQAGGSDAYSMVDAPPLPFILLPGESVDVEVAFAPPAAGYFSAVLQVESTDSLNPLQEVFFGGVGVDTQPDPVTIQAILEFYDAGVAAGTIDGNGPSDRSQRAKRKVFRFILVAAGTLIEGGYYGWACHVLERAFIRSDGLLRPKDFIVGADVAELNSMIGQLMADMGC
jgi:hypothetical protein